MNNNNEKYLFEWEEWKMESADGISSIEVPGRPVSVSAAFTGKFILKKFREIRLIKEYNFFRETYRSSGHRLSKWNNLSEKDQ